MTRGRLRGRLEALEARQAAQTRRVVILWPDGVRDGFGQAAKLEGAALIIPMPQRAMTPGEVEAARQVCP